MIEYENGNTLVKIENDGTKHRIYENGVVPTPVFPESIDVKITNYCDMGCVYCHESSTTEGQHCNINDLLEVLHGLPQGVELAIGGGNPLSHPDLHYFLAVCHLRGHIVNLTVNQGHLKRYMTDIKTYIDKELIKGLGISILNNKLEYVKQLKELTNNVVFHVISGVNDISILDDLATLSNPKVLVLGYKQFGFGKSHYSPTVQACMAEWYQNIPRYFKKFKVVAFDNLAIEQLELKRLMTDRTWNNFYMGDDFTFTMYIDAVEKIYSPTSRSQKEERVPWGAMNLSEYFQNNRK